MRFVYVPVQVKLIINHLKKINTYVQAKKQFRSDPSIY